MKLYGNTGKRRPNQESASRSHAAAAVMGKKPRAKRKRGLRRLTSVVLALGFLYVAAVFLPIPGVRYLRDVWIESAMTTAAHQWLAEMFIPKFIIADVMSRQVVQEGLITNVSEISVPTVTALPPETADSSIKETAPHAAAEVPETPDNSAPSADELGNKILVEDRENGIRIVEISHKDILKAQDYTGYLMIVDNPSQVAVQTTDQKMISGEFIADLCADAGAIAGVNANGFDDPDGVGNGGTVLGCTMSAGELWGQGSQTEYTTMGWDAENRFIVGQITDYEKYNLRDFVQYKPALIVDGKQLLTGSAGWGIAPRTAIGQTKDGKMVFAVVDGRQPGYSVGITLGDLAEILMSYGVVNAAACDGGSSSILYYDGRIINTPSTPMKTTGRYLPNAVVVKTAETQ